MLGTLAFVSFFSAASQDTSARLRLVLGVSRTLEFPGGFSSLRLSQSDLLDYRRVLRGNGGMALLLLPRHPGKTHLVINGTSGRADSVFEVEVVSGDGGRALAMQKEEERFSGLRVKEANLMVGVPFLIQLPGKFGPVYLTDDSILSFRRLPRSNGTVALQILPKRAGFTDLTLHDVTGQPLAKYYFKVTP